MPSYYCFACGAQREHLNVKRTAELAQVTRATVYNWLHAGHLHVITHPSGRKYICSASVLDHHMPLDCEDVLPDAATGVEHLAGFQRRRDRGARLVHAGPQS